MTGLLSGWRRRDGDWMAVLMPCCWQRMLCEWGRDTEENGDCVLRTYDCHMFADYVHVLSSNHYAAHAYSTSLQFSIL